MSALKQNAVWLSFSSPPGKPVVGPMSHSPEWYAMRSLDMNRDRPVVLGASEAAAVCGLSPYTTQLTLYLEKRGDIEKEFSEDQQERMDFGTKLEPIVLEAYAQRLDVIVEGGQPMFFHPDHPWMACTPDGIAVQNGQEWGVEVKCTSWRMYDASGDNVQAFGESETDQVPTVYLLQAQWQMAVMGWDRVDLPVLFDGSKLRIYTVNRDETLISTLIAAGEDMVSRILEGNPPEPDWSHDGTRAALQALYQLNHDADAVDLSEDCDLWWWQYQELGQQAKEIESRRAELYNRMMAALRDAPAGRLPNGQKLTRSVIADSYVTEKDVADLVSRIGEVKRKGYQRLNGPRK